MPYHSRVTTPRKPRAQASWRDVLSLPGRAARFAMRDAPFSSRLEVTGVSLSLLAHDDRAPDLQLCTAMAQSHGGGPPPDRPPSTPNAAPSMVSERQLCAHNPGFTMVHQCIYKSSEMAHHVV